MLFSFSFYFYIISYHEARCMTIPSPSPVRILQVYGILKGNTRKGDHIVGCLGNVLWFVFGGFWQGLGWSLAGVLWCVTIIGIPIGRQCFKFASLSFMPFGKQVVYGGSAASVLMNILWLLVTGLPMALGLALNGLLFCITIVGIPFGMQCFKLAKLALMPFGATII